MVFDEESEDSIYWLFSNFVKKLESQLNMKEELVDYLQLVSSSFDVIFCFTAFCFH